MTTTKPRAKRKLKDISFEHEGAHVALVSKEQGGPANGHDYALIMKSMKQETIQKASEITVTMDIVEYLRRFFGVWKTDAELLARALGFTTVAQEKYAVEQEEDMREEAVAGPEEPEWDSEVDSKDVQKWVASKLQSIQVMKSLHEAKNFEEALANISEEDYIQLLQDQQVIEKALLQIESEAEVIADDTPNSNGDKKGVKKNTSVVKQKLGEDMTTKDQVEMIEKSAFVVLQKSLDDTKVELNKAQEELKKALEDIAKFQEEKKEAILKSRKELVLKAVGVAEQAEAIFAGLKDAEDAVFNAAVETLANITKAVEQSDLFKEVGKTVEGDRVEEDPVVSVMKSKYKTK